LLLLGIPGRIQPECFSLTKKTVKLPSPNSFFQKNHVFDFYYVLLQLAYVIKNAGVRYGFDMPMSSRRNGWIGVFLEPAFFVYSAAFIALFLPTGP
jgi:hypothetical protein